MHDTRLQVLEAIKNRQPATVASLAESLGLSPISIRHHLTSLQAEGLIKVEIERQGVGRPKHLYLLTEAALRYFPNNYHVLVERLLDEMKALLTEEQMQGIIDGLAAKVASRYGALPPHGTLDERLNHLVDILGEEGFMAAVQRVDDKTFLAQLNCPYQHVGQRHPEVCRIDHSLIETVLGMDVQQTSCLLQGGRACTFSVKES